MVDTKEQAEEIRAGIERAREEIERSVADLQEQVRSSMDYRRYVRRHPAAFFACAVAAGVVVARLTSR